VDIGALQSALLEQGVYLRQTQAALAPA
jgi:hypothetical protein